MLLPFNRTEQREREECKEAAMNGMRSEGPKGDEEGRRAHALHTSVGVDPSVHLMCLLFMCYTQR